MYVDVCLARVTMYGDVCEASEFCTSPPNSCHTSPYIALSTAPWPYIAIHRHTSPYIAMYGDVLLKAMYYESEWLAHGFGRCIAMYDGIIRLLLAVDDVWTRCMTRCIAIMGQFMNECRARCMAMYGDVWRCMSHTRCMAMYYTHSAIQHSCNRTMVTVIHSHTSRGHGHGVIHRHTSRV